MSAREFVYQASVLPFDAEVAVAGAVREQAQERRRHAHPARTAGRRTGRRRPRRPARSSSARFQPSRVRTRWSSVSSSSRPSASVTRRSGRVPRASAPSHGVTTRTRAVSQPSTARPAAIGLDRPPVAVGGRDRRARGEAGDVVADPGRADVVGVGDGAADRLRVADVAVGAERAAQGVAGVGAALELGDGALVDVAVDRDRGGHRNRAR